MKKLTLLFLTLFSLSAPAAVTNYMWTAWFTSNYIYTNISVKLDPIQLQTFTTNDSVTVSNYVYDIVASAVGGLGGSTNGITMLNGFGTNTTLYNPIFPTSNYYRGYFVGDASSLSNFALSSYTNTGVLTTNDFGRSRTAALRSRIHRIPPMGMDTWYLTGTNHSANTITQYVDIAFTNGLVDLGWEYISITEGWQGYYSNNVLMPNLSTYPNITNTIAYAHSKGMKVRLYTEPTATTSAGLNGTPYDKWEDSIKAWASWGVDDIQFDIVGIGSGYDMEAKANVLRAFSDTLRHATIRPISIYSGGFRSPTFTPGYSNYCGLEIAYISDTWRQVGDLGADEPAGYNNAWTNYTQSFVQAALEASYTMNQGSWHQIDHLFLNSDSTNASRGTFAMNAIMASPMFVGIFAGPSEAFRYSILTNRVMLRIARDSAGFPATRVFSNSTHEIFVRTLNDNTKAVALMNKVTNATTSATFTAAQLGWPSNTPLYYVSAWHGTNGLWTNAITHIIPEMTADLFHVWPLSDNVSNYFVTTGNGSGGISVSVIATNGLDSYTNSSVVYPYFTGLMDYAAITDVDVNDMIVTNLTLLITNKILATDTNGAIIAATTTNGTAGQFLADNGSGVFYWATASGTGNTYWWTNDTAASSISNNYTIRVHAQDVDAALTASTGIFTGSLSAPAITCNGNSIYYSTNAASDVTIDYSKPYSFLSTNNNLNITGRTSYNATNFNQALVTVTNTSAAAKTITMAATFLNMNASEGNTLYCTNLGQLLVFEMNGTGTNFYWKSR